MAAAKKPGRGRARPANLELNGTPPNDEVLTLTEVAAFLRIDEDTVLRSIADQGLPARQVGAEWRFLKPAIQRWLSHGKSPDSSKAAQLAVVGSWRNDPYVDDELEEIYRRRRTDAGEAGS